MSVPQNRGTVPGLLRHKLCPMQAYCVQLLYFNNQRNYLVRHHADWSLDRLTPEMQAQ
jgi:hypothetical protein